MTDRFAVAVLVLIASLLLLSPFASGQDAQPECGFCSDAHTVACPTCEGDGRATLDCDTCRGRGHAPCPRPHVLPKPAQMTCPNPLCRFGHTPRSMEGQELRGGGRPCKVCKKKGWLKCRSCKEKSKWKCVPCRGKGTVERECDDCAGTGRLLCLVCSGSTPCVACNDTHDMTCPRCDGKIVADQPCDVCAGVEKHLCHDCGGSATVACENCLGTGEVRVRYTDGGSTDDRCQDCSRKGATRCGACKRGVTDCAACRATGRARTPCRLCRKSGNVPCRACGEEGYRVPELEGALLAERGDVKNALELYERAWFTAKEAYTLSERQVSVMQNEEPVKPEKPESLTVETVEAWVAKINGFHRVHAEWEYKLRTANERSERMKAVVERIDAARRKLQPKDDTK